MAQQLINIGAAPNDGTGDTVRAAFNKTNGNFTETYAAVPTHEAASDPHPQYLTAAEGNAAYDALGAASAAVTAHEAASDPHTGYQQESGKNAANGYAGLSASTKLSGAQQTYGTATDTACVGNDARLSDSRTPLAHASSHQSGGSDAIKLDDLAASDDNTDLNASTSKHGLMQKYPGGTTNFLRADGTFATPPGGAGAFAITTVETNVGTTAVTRGAFTITDAGISASSKIIITHAPGPYTGKGTRADEAEMDQIVAVAIPATGTAEARWRVSSMVSPREPLKVPFILGRVKGNIKFHYTIA